MYHENTNTTLCQIKDKFQSSKEIVPSKGLRTQKSIKSGAAHG